VLQIIGTKKCPDTRKALRFCKERSIPCQFVDLGERKLSDGEWKKIFAAHRPQSLIDEQSAYYKKEGYAWRAYEPEEELVLHPELVKTPLIKLKNSVCVGYNPECLEAAKELQ
jgi:arsenate reductase-like glutaredoxin family protein